MTQGADRSDWRRMVGGRQPHTGAEEHSGLRDRCGQPAWRKSSLRRCRRPSGSSAPSKTIARCSMPCRWTASSFPRRTRFTTSTPSAALAKGCHVLVEKPMTTTARDARDLVARAKRAGREIVIPYGWNFKPWTDEARRLATKVGRIEHVVLQMANALDDLFAGKPMIETEGAMFRPPASTWADPKSCGRLRLGATRPPARPAFPCR